MKRFLLYIGILCFQPSQSKSFFETCTCFLKKHSPKIATVFFLSSLCLAKYAWSLKIQSKALQQKKPSKCAVYMDQHSQLRVQGDPVKTAETLVPFLFNNIYNNYGECTFAALINDILNHCKPFQNFFKKTPQS